MGQIGSWNGIVFEVSPNVVRGYTGLAIEGGSQTEEKVSDKFAYVQRKNSTPTSVNMDVYLNAYLGCNVRDEAMALIKAATDGAKNYFYVAGKKLVECQLMLVNAKVTEVTSTPSGEWTSCRIALTMKQCEKYSGGSSSSSGGSSGGGSGGGGTKTTQPKKETVKQQSWVEKAVDAVKTGVSNVVSAAKNVVSKVTNAIKNVTSKATSTTAKKAESAVAKKVSAVKKVTTAAKKATTTKKATTVQKPAAKKASTTKGKIKAVAK